MLPITAVLLTGLFAIQFKGDAGDDHLGKVGVRSLLVGKTPDLDGEAAGLSDQAARKR